MYYVGSLGATRYHPLSTIQPFLDPISTFLLGVWIELIVWWQPVMRNPADRVQLNLTPGATIRFASGLTVI
jgi:hypothetical protein